MYCEVCKKLHWHGGTHEWAVVRSPFSDCYLVENQSRSLKAEDDEGNLRRFEFDNENPFNRDVALEDAEKLAVQLNR